MPTRSQRPARSHRSRVVFLASIAVSFLAASSAPTPLYGTYQREWGFSDLTVTVVFAIYAIALLAALLAVGRLSDHVGRRPALLAGIVGQAATMAIFVDAHGVAALVIARTIQGLAAGAALGAIGAAMLDLDPVGGAVANSTAPGMGTAIGALGSSFAVQWLPAPSHLVYVVVIAVLAVQAAGVWRMAETSPRAPGARRSLVPAFAVPAVARRPLLTAAPVLFAVWALAGFYGSLGPSLAAHLTGSTAVVYGGLGLGLLALVGSLTTYVLRATPAPRVMLVGTAALIAGVALALAAVAVGTVTGFLAATAVAGVGFGAGFQGGIRLVVPLARPEQRAGLLSIVYVVSYLGFGLPAVLGGLAVVESGDLLATTYGYGAAVIALAAVATANLVLLRSPRPAPTAAPCPRTLDTTA